MATLREFNNMVRQYNRRGIEDNALASARERLDEVYQKEFGRDAPKVKPVRMNGSEGFNQAVQEIIDDFMEDDTKKIKMFDMRKKENRQRIETFKRNHPKMKFSYQAYIDYIENMEDFRDQVVDLAQLPSKQIREIFEVGKKNKLTEEQVTDIASNIANRMTGAGMNIDQLALLIRQVTKGVTKKNYAKIDYDKLINAITEGDFEL